MQEHARCTAAKFSWVFYNFASIPHADAVMCLSEFRDLDFFSLVAVVPRSQFPIPKHLIVSKLEPKDEVSACLFARMFPFLVHDIMD